jgi:hypothetical protein
MDERQSVLETEGLEPEINVSRIKGRNRTALEVYDEKQAREAEYEDPLFDE